MIEHRIKANGLTHFVRDDGPEDAPVAILLHGFPDSSAVWSAVTPLLVAEGFRIIAPDMRGFGETDMAPHTEDYEIFSAGAVPDVMGVLDRLNIERAHVVGHDFGAPVGWALAALHPERFITLTALSVGHPRAFMKGGFKQKLMSWYIVFHQLRGFAEWGYRYRNWRYLRKHWKGHPDPDGAIALLEREGRLTAGLNWYRANMSFERMLKPPPFGARGNEFVRIPTLGIWSDGDKYLDEKQMETSGAYVKAPWRYERLEGVGHWISYEAPERLAELLADFWRAHSA